MIDESPIKADTLEMSLERAQRSTSGQTIPAPRQRSTNDKSQMDVVPLATTAGLCDESGHDPKCMVCGDKSAGKHYGVMACYGCKGFFRRTIRAEQHYVCRFDQCCNIDKDQRNACRFCRFQRCLFVGMEPEAIRPDRDIIGKQKNPRKRKLLMIKQEEISQNGAANVGEGGGSSSLPSPGGDSTCSQQEDLLLNYLLKVELKNSCYDGPPNNPAFGDPRIAVGCAVGIAHPMAGGPPARLLRRAIKLDTEVTLAMLFENRSLLDEFRGATSANSFVNTFINGYDASNLNGALGSSPLSTDEEEAGAVAWREAARAGLAASAGQLADAEHIADAMRSHVLQCISWINTLFYMANAPRVEDKATQTVRYAPEESPTVDALCLCNGSILPRNAAAQPYLDTTNLLANNMVARVLDELVFPLRRVRVTEPERAALTALIILEGNSRNVHTSTSEALRALKEKIQNALFQHIRERTAGAAGLMADRSGSVARASLRFANILLLLPSVAKVAAVYYENAQLAKMFGRGSLDPLLAEIFLEAAPATGAVSSAAAAAMAAAGVKDGGIFGNFYADEPSTSTSGYGSHGPSSADYYTSKPLTINCEMSYGGGSSGVYGTCSYVSAPNSTSRDSVKMCYDASTQTSPDHIATAVGADAMAPAGVIDFNARAYSDSGRFTQSSDYSVCQERQHYASGDSCISVGSLGGDDSRAIGLMDSVGISFDSTMRRDFKSMDVGAVASVAPPSVVATTGSAEASAGADFAGEDDAAQMTTIIAMGLDLADEHSRKSTIKSKLETQDYTITDETLLDAANQPSVAAAQFHRRHPSGVSTASSSCCTVEPISPPHLIGVAAPPPPANVIDTTPSSLLAVYTSGADHTTASAAIGASTSVVNAKNSNNNSSTAFGDLLRGISGAVIHNVTTGASSPDTVTIVGYAPPTVGEMCAPSASSNLYVSYSQLHQQMAQQHQNALADSGMIYDSGYGGTGIENGNNGSNGSNGTAIDRYDNTTNSVVQQFFPSEQQTQGQQQQELQYVAHPHHQQQPQEQMYQQFFNAEQLILQQQQSQVSFDFNGAVTARAGAPASYPLSAFKFA